MLDDAVAIEALTTRNVHAYYTGRLAVHLGTRLALAHADRRGVVLTAGAG